MRIERLGELAPARLRTVVINAATDLVATRAVLSARANVGAPVLLVNCDPTPASTAWADRLAGDDPGVDVVDLPLRLHGETLDRLFRELPDERVLLLDSDAEVRDPDLVGRWERDLDRPGVYAAGWTQGPNAVPEHWSPPIAGDVLHMERPWIPCTLFAAAPVREALAAGRSFLPRYVPNEAGSGRRLSTFLAARWGPPWAPRSRAFEALPGPLRRRAARWPLRGLRPLRDRYYFRLRPCMAFYDTGADVHEHLRVERGLLFAGGPVELLDDEVHHYSGVTRVAVVGRSVDDVEPAEIEAEVVERLRAVYGVEWAG